MFIRSLILLLVFHLMISLSIAGWNPFQKKYKRSGEENARILIEEMRDFNPKVNALLHRAVAYAVFPRVSKLAFGVGGGGGNGKVFYKGNLVGTCKLTQVSFGFQIGGQVFSEVILFQDERTFALFRKGEYRFGGGVSLAVLDDGWGEELGFRDGTAVLIKGQKGLMYEAAVKGQKFSYKPLP